MPCPFICPLYLPSRTTATNALPPTFTHTYTQVPRVVLPLAAERVYHSSDVGRSPLELSDEFPDYDFSGIAPIWWFNGKSKDVKRVVLEPDNIFFDRMERLREWLLARPESTIAVVTHWGVINVRVYICACTYDL